MYQSEINGISYAEHAVAEAEHQVVRLQIEKGVAECAAELLSDFSRWAQGSYAQNAEGHTVEAYAPDAARWCAVGAARKCCSDQYESRIEPAGFTSTSISSYVQAALDAASFHLYSGDGSVIGQNDSARNMHGMVLGPKARWARVRKIYAAALVQYDKLIASSEEKVAEARKRLREANGTQA